VSRARLLLPVAALLALWLLTAAPAVARGVGGLELVSSQRIDKRLRELTLRSNRLSAETGVRVLLPASYTGSQRRYPVLYLLHGAIGDYRDWTEKGEAERLTAGRPLIVVMPDSGPNGRYVNWFNGGAFGPPEWESYHVGQLIDFIDARFRTIAVRRGRAIGGLSMGGYGAMHYAARHPDEFAAAAAFSGALDTSNPLDIAITPAAVYGPPDTEEVRWRGHNPTDLAENLRPVDLTIRTGNGEPGGPFGGGDIVEKATHAMSLRLHRRLLRLGIPHVWDDYGPGGHLWPYWQRDLKRTLPHLMRVFAGPDPAPATVGYRSIEHRYSVFGWQVRIEREALEFSRLADADRRGFRLSGSGSARVRTAPILAPGRRYEATIHFERGSRTRILRAGGGGRVSLRVPLGPSNTAQQYTAGAQTRVFHTSVSFRPAP
jgi:S-formylglutathione hydrolase FrmB